MRKKLMLMLGAAAVAVSAQAAVFAQGEAFAYEIAPGAFSFELAGDSEGYQQYPADALKGQASMEYGFGMASAWFNTRKFDTPAAADEWCPVVADPFNEGGYAIRMQTTAWDGFGNFNFALPEVGEPCRIRVVYRVDEKSAENAWYKDKAQKTFKVKLMDDADQETYDYPQLEEYNEEFWDNPGWRVAEFVNNLDSDCYYLSLLWDAGGLSCQRNVAFYVEEVSVVPLSKLSDYTAPADGKALNVVTEMPTLVKIDRSGSGVKEVATDINGAAIVGVTGGIAVNGYNGVVEVYNVMGALVAKTTVNGAAQIAVPAGVVVVKAGNTVAKVVVR